MNAHPPIISCETAPEIKAVPSPPAAIDSALLDTGKPLFDRVSKECSALTTKAYSTSFSLGIRMLSAELRAPIQAVYGFVRFADEIVDTFHDFNKEELFKRFKKRHPPGHSGTHFTQSDPQQFPVGFSCLRHGHCPRREVP